MGRAPRISAGHVVWAYDVHIFDWADAGLTAAQIRTKLREECGLHVGTEAVKAVLATRAPR